MDNPTSNSKQDQEKLVLQRQNRDHCRKAGYMAEDQETKSYAALFVEMNLFLEFLQSNPVTGVLDFDCKNNSINEPKTS